MTRKTFIKNFTVFFTGSAIVSIINYTFYPVVGRLLSIEAFGEMQVLMAIITQTGLVLGALSTVITQTIAAHTTNDDANIQLIALESLVVTMALPLLLVCVVCIPFLESYLNFDNFLAFFAVICCVYLSVIATFNTATMQGLQQFKQLSILGIILSLGKLLFAVLFISMGLGVFGGIFALLIAGVIGYAYSHSKVTKERGVLLKNRAEISKSYIIAKPLLRYGLHTFVGLASIAILFTSDILIVKHYFPADVAGLYAVVSTVAKIAFFALQPMSVVLLPTFAFRREGHFSIIFMAGAILLLMSAVGLVIVYFSHDQIISILFGSRYLTFSYLLPKLTLAMAMLAILQSASSFALAKRSLIISNILPLGPITFFALNSIRHETVDVVVMNTLISIIIPSLVLLVYYIARKLRVRL